MQNNRKTHVQLNRGKRLKDVKLRRLGGGNGAALSPSPLQPEVEHLPPVSPALIEESTSRILEHLEGGVNLSLPAQDERRLARALAVLGPEKTGEYSAAVQGAIDRINDLTTMIQETMLLMVKDTKAMIENKQPAWTEAGAKSRTEATLNLGKCQDLLQDYGRGLMGAPDRVEEHTHRFKMEIDAGTDPREALREMEQILTGRTINFLPPANGNGESKE